MKTLEDMKLKMSLSEIWERQTISDELREALKICVESIYRKISLEENVTDLRERLGRKSSWEAFKEIKAPIPAWILVSISGRYDAVAEKRISKQQKQDGIMLGIETMRADLLTIPKQKWAELYDYLYANQELADFQVLMLVKKASTGSFLYTAREKEVMSLYNYIEKARKNGILQ